MLLPERKLLLLCAKVTLFAVVMCDVSHIHNNHYDQRHLANQQQSSSSHEHHYHGQDGKYDALNDGTGWDIRLSVPGEPDRDYPTLNSVPRTAFSCSGKNPGYYADPQTRCQVFRVCANTAPTGFFSFLCPNGTLFNQEVLVCDWWMNVRCVDTERYSGLNQALTMKSGLAMMADIKKMIMHPMMYPYTAILPQMRQTYQTYNPPEGMFAEVQRPLNNNVQASELTDSFKLAMPFSTKKIDANRDSYSSGSMIGSTLQYQGAVPANHNPVYKESTSSSFFTRENFGGLSLQKSFDSSSNQALKVTKQQFTYPSQYDKQYTVPVPNTPTSPPLVVHFPINVPAIDNNSGVPIATAEALYESQKTINENYQKKQSEFNSNFESQYFASQNTRNNEGKISSTQFTHFEPQQSVQKQESVSKNQNFQSQYQSSDVKSFDSKTSNAYKSNLNDKTTSNYQIASTPSTFNNPADLNVQRPENHSGGSFYSVQQSIYQNRKGPPSRIENRQEIAKAENATQEGNFVSTSSISGNPNQFEDYYNYGKFTNQNKSVNYSLQQNFQATKRIQTTVQTTVANSGYAESKGAFQSTKSHSGNTHNEGQLISVQQHSPLQIPQKPMPIIASTPAGVSFQKEINYSSFHTAHATPDNKQQQLKFEQFSQSVNKSPQINPEANVYRTNYIASSESTPPQQYSYSVTQQRAPTEQTAIKTHMYPNQVQADTSSVIYTSSGSSQNNDQSNQYSQYVNVPIKQNANLQYSSQQQNQNLIQNNDAPNYSPYPNQQMYSVPTQYPTQTQLEVHSNQKYEINGQKQHVGDYTTVEVVPALGFAIDSIRERQDYYNALTKGLQSVQNEYLPPYTQQRVIYATNDKSYSNSQDDKYQTYNENYRQNGNTQYSGYNSQYEGQNRLVQGQIIAHPQSQANGQSLPLEDFGYSQQKPNVPFTY
ncbi:uncharacterized protein LOC143916523 [Arctopsyche grandis]|uniref:uncharacterized protein LOC143916523 n=1 Tax=Arctopsyche grandis TaxID=121162 RepID=UPI00406D888E